jgi:hypothetical protein
LSCKVLILSLSIEGIFTGLLPPGNGGEFGPGSVLGCRKYGVEDNFSETTLRDPADLEIDNYQWICKCHFLKLRIINEAVDVNKEMT